MGTIALMADEGLETLGKGAHSGQEQQEQNGIFFHIHYFSILILNLQRYTF
jgi:hypothetical protein